MVPWVFPGTCDHIRLFWFEMLIKKLELCRVFSLPLPFINNMALLGPLSVAKGGLEIDHCPLQPFPAALDVIGAAGEEHFQDSSLPRTPWSVCEEACSASEPQILTPIAVTWNSSWVTCDSCLYYPSPSCLSLSVSFYSSLKC